MRAQFVASEFRMPLAEVTGGFAARDAAVRDHALHERIELWFEHDLYDQLQLIQVLDFFANERRTRRNFSGSIRRLSRSDGARCLARARVRRCSRQCPAIRERASALGRPSRHRRRRRPRGWRRRKCPAHPHLAKAMRRLLHELPAVGSGLSLNQERVLSACAIRRGPSPSCSRSRSSRKTPSFSGTCPSSAILDRMAFAPMPLIAGLPFESRQPAYPGGAPDFRTFTQSFVVPPTTGRAALAGEFRPRPREPYRPLARRDASDTAIALAARPRG